MRLTELVTPLKPLEAMAMGKLVVASDVGGHRELISDGVNGHLFQTGQISSLAAVVSSLLGARDTWDALHRTGREYVENERSWLHSVEKYRGVYGGVL